MTCIDLSARYSRRYRIVFEPQAADWPVADRPWLARIACRHGYVGAQGGERLFAWTDRPRIGVHLRALPFVERALGDAEVRVVFHVDHLDAVLAILRPYRRRRLSEEHRAALVAAGTAALARHRAAANTQSDFPAPGSPQAGEDIR
ncbi:hypothetical protein KF840_22415 [bacterium]|nr:hypothetical protein [bacterium]